MEVSPLLLFALGAALLVLLPVILIDEVPPAPFSRESTVLSAGTTLVSVGCPIVVGFTVEATSDLSGVYVTSAWTQVWVNQGNSTPYWVRCPPEPGLYTPAPTIVTNGSVNLGQNLSSKGVNPLQPGGWMIIFQSLVPDANDTIYVENSVTSTVV